MARMLSIINLIVAIIICRLVAKKMSKNDYKNLANVLQFKYVSSCVIVLSWQLLCRKMSQKSFGWSSRATNLGEH